MKSERQSTGTKLVPTSAIGLSDDEPVTRRGRRRWWRILAALTVFALVLGEAATRLASTTAPNGMQRFLRFPLLPFRPPADVVRANLERHASSTYIVPDAELGWTLAKGAHSDDGTTTTPQGFRGTPDRTYTAEPPPGSFRVTVCGDSFTHGDEVALEGTWAWQLEQMSEQLEVINLGVPAYGTDQALLRWRRDGRPLQSHVVTLGIWPENICRNLNLVRYYLQPAGGYLCKPRFTLGEGTDLTLINSPVLAGEALVDVLSAPGGKPFLGDESWYDESSAAPRLHHGSRLLRVASSLLELRQRKARRARLYSGEDPTGIELTVAIARRFHDEVAATGATPLVVILPMRDLLDAYPGDDDLPLARQLRAAGLPVVNLFPAFATARTADDVFLPSGHLTVDGNRLVATELHEQLLPLAPR